MTSHPTDGPSDFGPRPREVPLKQGRLSLESSGLRYAPRGGSGTFYLYRDITHLGTRKRGIWIGTRQGCFVVPHWRFEEAGDDEHLAEWLTRTIRRFPEGEDQLARIARVDQLVRNPMPRIATTVLAVLCILGMALQFYEPFVGSVATFAPALVGQGEWWRIWTGSLLHSPLLFPIHLASNLALILGFALLVERPLGALATTVILGASGLGAMVFSTLAGYDQVIGASGIAAGLVGSVLCLDLYFPQHLPAWWRLPRQMFITILLVQLMFDLMLPMVAAAAHLGGFAAGFLMTQWVAENALQRTSQPNWVKLLAASLVLTFALSLAAPIPLLQRDGAAMARHTRALLAIENVTAVRYNEIAWRMATESDATPQQLEAALEAAERAVYDTDRRDPDFLDTLAEVQYVIGHHLSALQTIDEAIQIAIGEEYFIQQRRRFTGEREWQDRPPPPGMPWMFRNPESGREFLLEPGIEV